jgi:hypothetical protein
VQRESQFERQALQSLRAQTPVRDLPGVRIRAVKAQPEDAFDVQFELQSGKRRIVVLGEFKSAVPLKLLEDIAPWIRRMKNPFVPVCRLRSSAKRSLRVPRHTVLNKASISSISPEIYRSMFLVNSRYSASESERIVAPGNQPPRSSPMSFRADTPAWVSFRLPG